MTATATVTSMGSSVRLQATAAILRAWRAGKRRQQLELMLPVPTAGGPRATGDLSWPGGIRQQFRAARPMVEKLLRRVRQAAGLQASCAAEELIFQSEFNCFWEGRPDGGNTAAPRAPGGWPACELYCCSVSGFRRLLKKKQSRVANPLVARLLRWPAGRQASWSVNELSDLRQISGV